MCIVCVLNVQCVCNDCDINQCSWGHGATVGTIYPQVLISSYDSLAHTVICTLCCMAAIILNLQTRVPQYYRVPQCSLSEYN